MKHLLNIILSVLLGYGLLAFTIWDWNITSWEYYMRLCLLLISIFIWLIITLIENTDKTLNDESTRNDEILDTYYNHKNKKQHGTYIHFKRNTERMV